MWWKVNSKNTLGILLWMTYDRQKFSVCWREGRIICEGWKEKLNKDTTKHLLCWFAKPFIYFRAQITHWLCRSGLQRFALQTVKAAAHPENLKYPGEKIGAMRSPLTWGSDWGLYDQEVQLSNHVLMESVASVCTAGRARLCPEYEPAEMGDLHQITNVRFGAVIWMLLCFLPPLCCGIVHA